MNRYDQHMYVKYGLSKKPGIWYNNERHIVDNKNFHDIECDGESFKMGESQTRTTNNNWFAEVLYRFFTPTFDFLGEISVLYNTSFGTVSTWHLPYSTNKPEDPLAIAKFAKWIEWLSQHRGVTEIHIELPIITGKEDYFGGDWKADDPYEYHFNGIGFIKDYNNSQGYLAIYKKGVR